MCPEDDAGGANPPKSNAADYAYAMAKAGLAHLPVVGGTAAELFSVAIASPLAQRRDRWLTDLALSLQALEARVEALEMESLPRNEVFVTTVIQTSQAAIKTHDPEKLNALRNAVLNAALGHIPEDELLMGFLAVLDTFTATHLRLLDLINDPNKWYRLVEAQHPDDARREGRTKYYAFAIDRVLTKYAERAPYYNQLAVDLQNRGFVPMGDTSPIANMHHGGKKYLRFSRTQESGLTPLGREFWAFLCDPLKQEGFASEPHPDETEGSDP